MTSSAQVRYINTFTAPPPYIKPTAALSPHSPWHSPVPYLFGGLAAMLGLIAFALLILACSYWRLSGQLDGAGDERDLEAGGDESSPEKPPRVMEEKFLVIMAGEVKPTYLATPATSRSSSFASSKSTCSSENSSSSGGEKMDGGDDRKQSDERINGHD